MGERCGCAKADRRSADPRRAGGPGRDLPPDRAVRVATSAVADSVCAKTFVSGLDPDAVFAETMDRPGIRRLRAGMRYRLDRAAKTVDVSMMGLLGSQAAFHDGFGCVLLHGSEAPYLLRSD